MAKQASLFLAVGLGAALGSVARSLASVGMIQLFGLGFAWGTLGVNILGSLLIGLYAAMTEPEDCITASPAARHFVMTGFCGGFTTFSFFSLETLLFIERGDLALAGLNAGLSVLFWLAAVWLGYRLGIRLNRTDVFLSCRKR
ncbi:CrcB family protein [Telmatospirillum sp. J64-1]|uniref:fluoride efflux transporter FluC n=1 Tax=Telmatospirillum sp. J64-1 TaxID=2502183 RepID=UPI00115E77BD|nr:CrcB family protein [Telmatospirillum sp. J64-1]